jgi:hypothetical protein
MNNLGKPQAGVTLLLSRFAYDATSRRRSSRGPTDRSA